MHCLHKLRASWAGIYTGSNPQDKGAKWATISTVEFGILGHCCIPACRYAEERMQGWLDEDVRMQLSQTRTRARQFLICADDHTLLYFKEHV